MKNFTKTLMGVALFFLAASASFGQTKLTATSLSSAVTSSATSVTLGSVTGVTANTILFIEDGTSGGSGQYAGRPEAMFVVSVPASGTTVQVQRGYDQTPPAAHISGAVVLLGPASAFHENEPTGSCTATAIGYTPYVNLRTGNQWLCSTIKNSWVPGWFNVSAPAGVSAAVASVAGATNPSGPLFHVTGTNAITAWGSSTTVGPLGAGGSHTDVIGASFCVIPDAAFTTTATNNIAKASTAVANQVMCFTFDQTNSKYVASY
ncbi:MAG TPA: hypothetical protein VN682_00690 [Terriglobales bacterium]|nr:hypothetical protein [Terriglobales bacterium]